MRVRVQAETFDVGAEIDALYKVDHRVGAVASFVGSVRERTPREGLILTLEHYPGMTERALEAIVKEAEGRFQILGVTVIHRIGTLTAGDAIVFVAVASAHRDQAFAACEFIMDYLKTEAPFWKKETVGGHSQWVEARASDDAALSRWKAGPPCKE